MRAVIDGDVEQGFVDWEHAGESYWAHSMRRSTGNKKRAAPLPKCHRSDADNGDRRRPAASYRGNGALRREEENGDAQEGR